MKIAVICLDRNDFKKYIFAKLGISLSKGGGLKVGEKEYIPVSSFEDAKFKEFDSVEYTDNTEKNYDFQLLKNECESRLRVN